ncbi:MAG: HAMP domain-containing protein [Alphaproteobacteria bacterium]|nr:MAG: HAMP domain-containing protein [Alphaproteobacteria bacterium]
MTQTAADTAAGPADTAPPSSPQRTRAPLVKRILPRTLLGRSLLIILLPLVLLQVISTWVFYDRHYDTTTKRLSQAIAGDIATVIHMMVRNPGAVERAQAFRIARRAMWLELSFEEGARLPEASSTRAIGPFASILDRKLTKAMEEFVGRPFLIDTVSYDKQVKIQVQLADGVLTAMVPRQRLFSSTTYIFIMWMVGSSIILFAVAVLFMRNQVRPIRRLAQAAESFGKGHDVAGFKPEGAAEVRQAAAAFLQMRSRIKRQIDQRTEFLAGVSHDLRTPLTRMKLQLAMFGETPEVADLRADVAEMERMLDGYLAFARGEGTEQPQPSDIGALLRDIVAQMRRDGSAIDLHVETEMTVPLRREAMRRCLANLIANARRYARHVWVRAGQRGRTLEIIIDDDGPGIPADKREMVFRPFYRLDESRNPETGGVGLGLTIARDVVRNHGGDLVLEDAPGGGLRARLWLPV